MTVRSFLPRERDGKFHETLPLNAYGPGFRGAIGYHHVKPGSGSGTLAGGFRGDIDSDFPGRRLIIQPTGSHAG